MIQKPVRVRFAPSPTGDLHIGSLRTALFNWLFARHYGGQFLIRIEDTDRERSKTLYTDAILAALRWVDIQADEPIITQTARLSEYQRVIAQLLKDGNAYKCYCSQDDIVQRAKDSAFIKYDGYCRDGALSDKPYVVRFKLPAIDEIVFHDLIRGEVSFAASQLDDFIIMRSDGMPIYNFVVVVDDNAMQISQVIRGEDHISNTPKQILLYQACGFPLPQFAHIPLILGPSGDRLSKRDGAVSVLAYKKEGYLPDALINYLVRLGWAHGNQEIFSRDQLIEYFTLEGVGKANAIFDYEKLKWVNSVYIKNMSNQELCDYIVREIDPDFALQLEPWDADHVGEVIGLFKERVSTLDALMHEAITLRSGPTDYNQTDLEKWITPQTTQYLEEVITALNSIEDFTAPHCATVIKNLANQLEIKFALVAQPIRIALLGKSSGPGIFALLDVLGKKESINRIVQLSKTL